MTQIMIDWISARVPCRHLEPITGGRVLKLTAEGEKVWEVATSFELQGSYDSSILLRTCGFDEDRSGVMLEISGNPTKWLQGHNLFGGFSQPGPLIEAFMYQICDMLPELQPTAHEIKLWLGGSVELTRVDLTQMYCLDSRASVRSWIRAAEFGANLRNRGRGTLAKHGTLYFGQHSRRWSLKIYSKGDELEAGGKHTLSKKVENPELLQAYADKALRVEAVLRSMDLKRRGINYAYNWNEDTGMQILNTIIEGLSMSDHLTLPFDIAEKMPVNHLAVYNLWRAGHDLRTLYSKPTFYRHRKTMLQYGIDIAVVQRPSEQRENVVPLIRVLEAKPMEPPAWAHGTKALIGMTELQNMRKNSQLRLVRAA